MSFSQEVKEEVTTTSLSISTSRAMLSSIIKINGSLFKKNNELVLSVRSEVARVAKLIFTYLQTNYNVEARLYVAKKTTLKKNNYYIIEVNKKVRDILLDLAVMDQKGLPVFPDREILCDNDCIKSYITGAFLAAGSINPPTTRYYHLEINLHDENHANYLMKLIKKFRIEPKLTVRKNNYVIYIKKAEYVSDFLRLMNAHNSLIAFEDERISRDFYNSNNRLSICEISNEVKILETGKRQSEFIETLKKKNLLSLLNEKDEIIAKIRLDNPEASLSDLAYFYEVKTGKTISKSGINHAFRRIMNIEEKMKD